MTAFEQAWDVAKMPIYDTNYPGIRFVTYAGDETDAEEGHTRHSYGSSEKFGDAVTENRPGYGIEMMRPSEYLRAVGWPGGNFRRRSGEGGPLRTPREVGDFHYRDLMDRAQAGEDIVFGMPYINFLIDGTARRGAQDGRHRMSELLARGDRKVPVVAERDANLPHYCPENCPCGKPGRGAHNQSPEW
tara:strand:+ start:1155 stop:1718 length:564 start_codon:yes stop_codon:yes gene_type:complete